jgi:hypothetical protein
VGDQRVDGGVIPIEALGLPVGPVRTADPVALVPAQADPAKHLGDLIGPALHVSSDVGVLDTQHK